MELLLQAAAGSSRGGKTKGGHTSPLFLEYGKAGPTVLATPLGRGTLSHTLPPLKRWTKLLIVSLKPERGPLASRPQKTPAP